VLLAVVLVLGTAGYVIVGLDLFSAIYQTAITITTVGFGEVSGDDEVDNAYRVVTLVLVLLGASTAIYVVSVLLETVVEGTLNDNLRRRRMQREIDHMDHHVIVAGGGRVGRAIAAYVYRLGAPVVVIDRALPSGDWLVPVIAGEATDDEVLLSAGLERASTLVSALDTDADNLYVTVTAKALRKDLFVVVRTSTQANEPKFLRAGADRVVNPHEIGGSRMGALAMQPNVAEFLDEVLHDESHDVAIHEIDVAFDSPAIGSTIGELGAAQGGAMVIAIREQSGRYTTNPPPDLQVGSGDVLIVLGNAEQLASIEGRFVRRTGLHRFRGAPIADPGS
jgi:voltage-gated potassium channel